MPDQLAPFRSRPAGKAVRGPHPAARSHCSAQAASFSKLAVVPRVLYEGDVPEGSESTPLDRLGRPLRDLRISVTDRCNFRCGYCMPSDVFHEGYRFAPRSEILRFEEIARLAELFVRRLGVRKLRLTGGEPLLRRDLPELVRMLAAIPDVTDLALTTNGYLLAEQASALAAAGLRRVTVSLDALDQATFAAMSGRQLELARVLAGIEAAEAAGLRPLKLNCVVIRDRNEHAVEALARRFRGTPHVVRFIEFMDVGTQNRWEMEAVVGAGEIRERIERVAPLEALPPERPGEVAERFRYRDGGGEVGIIAAVSQPFCGSCGRARLSADGRLLGCLFASDGPNLRDLMRAGASDGELLAAASAFWQAREDRYSELRAGSPSLAGKRRLEMFQVGG
jgi:cyclic pyranopterin phosphate synthase